MTDVILVVNAGSSSLKFSVYAPAEEADPALLFKGQIEGIGTRPHLVARDADGSPLVERVFDPKQVQGHDDAIKIVADWLRGMGGRGRLSAVGHRVVHGGAEFAKSVVIDGAVLGKLDTLVRLAPLHQPANLAAIRAVRRALPELPQVACFDTAFHHTQPQVAGAFALPRRLTDEGVRRYGFHGLSYEYIASVLAEVAGATVAEGRVVVAHLGSGASMCAIKQRKSVATTMAFTALDGLVMSRRCGGLDPGVVLYLIEQKGMTAGAVSDLLYQSSGLLGVSGISDDMKTLLASDKPHAAEAVDLFVYRICRELGSLVAALGGFDALVFTAGIGEHAPEIRRRVCEKSAWLGLDIDDAANAAGGPLLTKAGGTTSAWMIPTDEDLMIARHTRSIV